VAAREIFQGAKAHKKNPTVAEKSGGGKKPITKGAVE